MPSTPNYFALFDLPVRYALDKAKLDAAYERLSFETHPDLVPQGDEAASQQAQALSAQLNEGYRVLNEEGRRAEHLLDLLAGGQELDSKALPQGFLQEMFLLQEEVDELDHAGGGEATREVTRQALREQVETRHAGLLAARTALLEQTPAGGAGQTATSQETLHQLQENLNCGRYLQRLLDRLDGQNREL